MESIIQTFHIDWKLIVAQMVNFAIVVAVLWFFALKPLAKKMSERTKTIEKSLEEAKTISDNLKKSEEERGRAIADARGAAQKILDEAKSLALSDREKNINEAKLQVQKVVIDGKRQITLEKEKMVQGIKNETADLVVLATTKLLEKIVDKKIDKELVKKALDEAKKGKL